MNTGSPEFGDHGVSDGTADLVVIEDEFGTALVGTDDALDQYMASLGTSLIPVQSESGTALAQMTDAIFGGRAVRSAYSIANHAQSVVSRPRPSPSAGAKVTYHRVVRDTGNGRILSNARIPDPGVAAMGLGPQAVALIALEAAIAAQFDEIHEHLDVIEDKVD